MNVDLELYRVFFVVAKNKNMTKASIELSISQPAISQSIKKLEYQLGGSLFLRSNKAMELTKEGKMFYEYIKGALQLIRNAENEFTSFQSLEKGEVKIGCSSTLTKLLLMDTLKQFHRDYPNIHIYITNDLTDHLIRDLKLGKLDLVIFNEGDTEEKNVNLIKIKELKQGFIYHPSFFQDHIKTFEELQKYPIILQKEKSNSRKLFDHISLQHGVKIIPRMEVVSQDLITEFVHIGLGIGFVILDLAKRNFDDLEELKLNEKIPNVNIYLATNQAILPTFASKTFISYLRGNLNS